MDDRTKFQADRGGFDVVKRVGRVEFGKGHSENPYQAAMRLIAIDGSDGTFSFPHQNGGAVHVIVEFEAPAEVA